MANRTFLLSTDSPAKPENGVRIEILCAASYMIPVFWYMLFDRSSVITVVADAEDGGKLEYPYFTRLGFEAVAAATSHWSNVRRAIGSKHDGLFEMWINYLTHKSQGYLQCETAELWMMFDDTPSFLHHVELCMTALSESRPAGESVAWQELLVQANAWDGKEVSPAGSFSFCGYEWEAKVPWE